ncbi:hypothetical protein LIT38_24410 [Bacillus sp. CMF12]|uniref:hypothetical protein n=1 Tax=Bacillus sp. CMF12 TaxID=2884834 RepID=UPI002079C727|nr:hypothetical protein [Bacillus sp. CMF12]USK49597.1 hypothetical protein LIT38_24410 [Bacillus sp. CMF12]
MEKIKYPVYDYMKFIRKKKLLLIGFTILCMVIGAGLSYTKQTVYTSTANVFTGNAENDLLSKPELITPIYKEELPDGISDSLNIKIVGPFHISLSLSGPNKEAVESNTKKVAEQYTQDLTERFNEQYEAQKNYKNALEGLMEETKETISQYNQLKQETSDENKLFNFTEALINKRYWEYTTDFRDADLDLSMAEPPRLIPGISTTQTSNNLLRNTILAGAFGFQLMLVLLVLWKYIINARRALSERK